jgi:hypothetical protein
MLVSGHLGPVTGRGKQLVRDDPELVGHFPGAPAKWQLSQRAGGASAQKKWQTVYRPTNPGTLKGHEDRTDRH